MMIVLVVIALMLTASTVTAQATDPISLSIIQPPGNSLAAPALSATGTDTVYLPLVGKLTGTEPYAYYDFNDSFENVSDANLGAYGITSALNTVKVNNTSRASGLQSIEADGIIGDDQHYSLYFDFEVQKILGSSSYDFSNKTIVLSVFIPADSPIEEIWFEADKGDEFVQITNAKITENPNSSWLWTSSLPKGQWVEAVIDLRDTSNQNPPNWGYTWGPNGPLTNEDALQVVKHCETFKIRGMNGTSGGPVSTYFLLDDLRWLDRDNLNVDPNADSLRKYAASSHLTIGSYAEYGDLFSVVDAKFSQVLAQEFNSLQVAPHFNEFEPSEGVIDFSKTDAMVDFAIGNHMAVFSYMGGVHTQLPAWLMDKSQPPTSLSELQLILTNFIDTVGRHYKGKIAIWNVFSEVVNDAGDGFRNRQAPNTPDNHADYSPWVDGSDTSLIKAAFRQARISDPNSKLFLNDFFEPEIGNMKSVFFYNFVSELIAEGVPIDGVGFEMYLFLGTNYNFEWESDLPTYLSKVDANVKRYAALGLKVAFSEVEVPIYIKDIDTSTAAGQAELRRRINYQAQIYGGLMKVALANPNVIVFNTWDFTDRYSWIYDITYGNSRVGFPHMFDQDYKPKPAYYEVLDVLKGK
jgi:GH35 family endo-1,4-beta-xylanase